MSARLFWGLTSVAMLLGGLAATEAAAQTLVAGPDEAGYRAYTYPAYLRDISRTGRFVVLGDDQLSAPITLPFTFVFYGTPISSVQISSNGFLRFDATDSDAGWGDGQPLPGARITNIAAAYWSDLNMPQGNIRYQSIGVAPARQFVVGFYDVPHFSNGPRVTFEMILHEGTNAIEFQYGNAPSDRVHTQTVGIQNAAGNVGLQLAHAQLNFFNEGFYITAADRPSITAGPDAVNTAAFKVRPYLRNISSSGTWLPLGDNQVSAPIGLPFAFEFYGRVMTTVQISSNGFLRFPPTHANAGCCSGAPLPGGPVRNIAAGYWTDLNVPHGNVRYRTVGTTPHRQFVVGFYNVPHYPQGPRVTFEMILHEGTNALEFQYGNAPSDHTHIQSVGVENVDGTAGVQIAHGEVEFFNTGFLIAKMDAATNSEPTVDAGANQTLEAVNAEGASFTLSGSATDADNDALTFTWIGPFGTVTGETITVTLPAPAAGSNAEAYTARLTVDDGRGGTATDTVALTVTDRTAPVIHGIPAPIVTEATSAAGAVVSFGPLSAVDAVDGDRAVSCDHAADATFPLGTTVVTCTSVDLHDNGLDASFDISIVDTTAPSLTMPSDQTLEAKSAAGAVATFATAATDLVDANVAIDCTSASGGTFPLGVTTVSCTATDDAGNPSEGSFTITVRDTTAPALTTPQSQVLEATRAAGATATFAASATDVVDANVAVACLPGSGSTFPLGATTVTCTAVDEAGNRSEGSFTVTVRDTTAPELTTPANQVLEATSATGAVTTFAASARDLVDANVSITCTAASGGTFPLGVTNVSCTATDDAGNATSGAFSITVRDTTAPTLGPVTPSVAMLWPANHLMVPVTLDYSVTDAMAAPSCTVAVGSNEPLNGTGDGDTASDWSVSSATDLMLRAERAGTGNGRIYTLTVRCSDASGNASTATTTVTVPKNVSGRR